MDQTIAVLSIEPLGLWLYADGKSFWNLDIFRGLAELQ